MTSRCAGYREIQFLPGLCLPASPPVGHRADLSIGRPCAVLGEMSLRREVIEAACRPYGRGRVNDEILGYTEAYLHARVCPHCDREPIEDGGNIVCNYPAEQWSDSRSQLSEEGHRSLQAELSEALRRRAGAQGLDVIEAQ